MKKELLNIENVKGLKALKNATKTQIMLANTNRGIKLR